MPFPSLSEDGYGESSLPASMQSSQFSLSLNKMPSKSSLASSKRQQPSLIDDLAHIQPAGLEKKNQAKSLFERASISFSQTDFALPFQQLRSEDSQMSPRIPSLRAPSKSSLRPSTLPEAEEDEERQDEEEDDGDPLGLFKKGKRPPGGFGFSGGGANVKLSRLEIMDMINGQHRTYEAPKHRPRETLVEKLRQQNLVYLQDISLVTTRRLNAFNSKADEQASKLEQQQLVVQNATTALTGALNLKLDVGQLSDNLAKTCLSTVSRISVMDRYQIKAKSVQSHLENLPEEPSADLAELMIAGRSRVSEPPSPESPGLGKKQSRISMVMSNLSSFAARVNERQECPREQEYPAEWAQESEELLLRPRERRTVPPPAPKPKSAKKKGAGRKKKKVEKAPQPSGDLHPILRVVGPPAPHTLNDRSWEARSASMASGLIKKNPTLTNYEEAKKESSRAANLSARARRFLEVSDLLPKDTLVGQQLNRKLTEIRYTRPFLKFPELEDSKS